MIGELVGSYRVLRELGKGGMGVVYVAEHAMLGRKAVVKMLVAEVSADREVIDRFFNEAKAATQIKHPGIIQVFDFGLHAGSGSAFIVMELLEGETLSARIQRLGRISSPSAALIARQVASALGAAHSNGIVHRDLKPDNLFLVPDPDLPDGERVKIIDFGIAKVASSQSAQATRTGAVFGTPIYMSPEQCRSAAAVDARTDIYALGCILYEMLTGSPPFACSTIVELIAAHVLEEPRPPSESVASIPRALEQTVLRALAKAPEQRHASMAELAAELDGITGRRHVTPLPFVADVDVTSRSAPESLSGANPVSASSPVETPGSRAAVVNTKLGAAVGQVAWPPRARGWMIGVGIATLGICGIIAIAATRGGGGSSGASRAAAETATGGQPASDASVDPAAQPVTAPVDPGPLASRAALLTDSGVDAPPASSVASSSSVPGAASSTGSPPTLDPGRPSRVQRPHQRNVETGNEDSHARATSTSAPNPEKTNGSATTNGAAEARPFDRGD